MAFAMLLTSGTDCPCWWYLSGGGEVSLGCPRGPGLYLSLEQSPEWLVGTARAAASTFSHVSISGIEGVSVLEFLPPSRLWGFAAVRPGSLAGQAGDGRALHSRIPGSPPGPGFDLTLAGVQVFPSIDTPALVQSITHSVRAS